jgi:hypothetical protein
MNKNSSLVLACLALKNVALPRAKRFAFGYFKNCCFFSQHHLSHHLPSFCDDQTIG